MKYNTVIVLENCFSPIKLFVFLKYLFNEIRDVGTVKIVENLMNFYSMYLMFFFIRFHEHDRYTIYVTLTI